MAAGMLLALGDRTFSNPPMQAELRALLREMLHVCVRLAFRIDVNTGNATLAAVAEVTSAWDAEEAAQRAAAYGANAAPSDATDATETPDAAAMAACATTLILAAALAAGRRRRGREIPTFGAARLRRDHISAVLADGIPVSFTASAVMALPRPASGRAPPCWGGSEKWVGSRGVSACP